jgi:hypothetical protein
VDAEALPEASCLTFCGFALLVFGRGVGSIGSTARERRAEAELAVAAAAVCSLGAGSAEVPAGLRVSNWPDAAAYTAPRNTPRRAATRQDVSHVRQLIAPPPPQLVARRLRASPPNVYPDPAASHGPGAPSCPPLWTTVRWRHTGRAENLDPG